MRLRRSIILYYFFALPLSVVNFPEMVQAAEVKSAKTQKTQSLKPQSLLVNEFLLWRTDALLQSLAKRMNPLSGPPGDGAVGLNRRFPEKVLVAHQLEGWNWIRAGVALNNGYIVDRGIMAFEWAFARMKEDGSFGESRTVEVAYFLGQYARAVLLLRASKLDDRAKRLERLTPRLEASLRSPRSLLGERRWDSAEQKNWNTPQRLQAAAAAYWIGRILANPELRKTCELWLDSALKRQEANGFFPSGLPPRSRAALHGQLDSLEALQGLAWNDPVFGVRLHEPIRAGFRWIEASKPVIDGNPQVLATYAAWSKDPYWIKMSQKLIGNGAPKAGLPALKSKVPANKKK